MGKLSPYLSRPTCHSFFKVPYAEYLCNEMIYMHNELHFYLSEVYLCDPECEALDVYLYNPECKDPNSV